MFIIYLSIKRYLLLKYQEKLIQTPGGGIIVFNQVVLKNKKEGLCIQLVEAVPAFYGSFFQKGIVLAILLPGWISAK